MSPSLPPLLLQQSPDIGRILGELLPFLIFVAMAVVPSIAQSRKKARQRREAPRPPAPPAPSRERAPEPSPPSQAPASDLEERVRRYFEELSGSGAPKETRAPPPPEPARPAAAAPPPPVRRRAAAAPLTRQEAPLRPGRALARTRRSEAGRSGPMAVARKLMVSRRTPVRQGTWSLALKGRSLREAIVLREVLGPPRALDEYSR